jgi:DNA-directed RNA polymerase
LLRSAKTSKMTADAVEWLEFQVATTYGLDKKSMTQRLQWSRDNHSLITAVATDPIGNLSEWEAADEPWQFLAACEEFYHCVIIKDRLYTGLFVAVDATCSGLQILAGLARDKGTAALVNVLPSSEPQDAYRSVLEAMENIPPRLTEWMDRGVTKRSVMTIPYNATIQSSRDYIRDALHKNMPKDASGKLLVDKVSADEATILAKSLRNALNKIAPGCLAVRDWIGKEMAAAIKRGNDVIQWTTPSGFKVYQKRNNYDSVRLDLALLGRCQFSVVDKDKGPNPRKHKSSGAPNLIHSLDASLLHISFQRFDVPFSVIHDSVLCLATDMTALSHIVRETYMHLFAEHDYLTDFARQIGAETEPPIIGDLEPESVIDSTYFFC